MKSFIGTTAFVFLAAMSTTATADSYHYTANGLIGSSDSFTFSVTITDTIVDQWQTGSGATVKIFDSSDVVFQFNEEEFNVTDFSYGQIHRLNNGVSTYLCGVSFHVWTDAGDFIAKSNYGVYFDDYIDIEMLRTYSGLTGEGEYIAHYGYESVEILSSSLVPIPGVGALAPLAGIAAIRRRRRR